MMVLYKQRLLSDFCFSIFVFNFLWIFFTFFLIFLDFYRFKQIFEDFKFLFISQFLFTFLIYFRFVCDIFFIFVICCKAWCTRCKWVHFGPFCRATRKPRTSFQMPQRSWDASRKDKQGEIFIYRCAKKHVATIETLSTFCF